MNCSLYVIKNIHTDNDFIVKTFPDASGSWLNLREKNIEVSVAATPLTDTHKQDTASEAYDIRKNTQKEKKSTYTP